MDFYKSATIAAIVSVFILLVSLFVPSEWLYHHLETGHLSVGVLFPMLPISWGASVIALAFNFLYIETLYFENYLKVGKAKKLLPSLLAVPSLFYFVWFCFSMV
jgi:hypothetical protein